MTTSKRASRGRNFELVGTRYRVTAIMRGYTRLLGVGVADQARRGRFRRTYTQVESTDKKDCQRIARRMRRHNYHVKLETLVPRIGRPSPWEVLDGTAYEVRS